MMGKTKIAFLLIVDFLFSYLSLFYTNKIVSPISESPLKILVVAVSYIVFIYAFNGYEISATESKRSNRIYLITLIVSFSILLSIVINFVIFFKTLGRKVYLIHSILAFIYLYSRNSYFVSQANQKRKVYILSEKIKNCDIIDGLNLKNIMVINDISCADRLNYSDLVIVNKKNIDDEELRKLFDLKIKGYSVYDIFDYYKKFLKKIPIDYVADSIYFFSTDLVGFDIKFYKLIKRCFDILFSLILLLLSSPVLVIVALLIKLDSKGKIFFKQKRTGLNGKFTIYKFRSMLAGAEKDGAQWASENDPRITKIGRIIRMTRLDELPQLINILKGDMSFVGPRPERPEFDEILGKQIPFYRLRYTVKPGLTGWAQINYEYGDSVYDAKQKLMYDLYYIKNFSIFLDLEIIIRTVSVVFLGKGR